MSTVVTTPPLGLQILYRTVGWRLGEPYREWVAADLADPSWFRRYFLANAAVSIPVGALVLGFAWWVSGDFPQGGLIGGLVALLFGFPSDRTKRIAVSRQLLPGAPLGRWARLPNGVVIGIYVGGLCVALLLIATFAR